MKKMLINAVHPEEIRVAVVEDGILKGLYIQSPTKEYMRGNIYKGRIVRKEQALHAVFVDFGMQKNGFLAIHDMNPVLIAGLKDKTNWKRQLKKGMEIPVQVTREESGSKGAQLTMNLSIPGRYMVLMPEHNISGISRKIEDENQRKKLKEIIGSLDVPENIGLIVRTAGMGKTKTVLSRDLNYLLRLWKKIEKEIKDAQAPCLIYQESDIVTRSIRDYFTPDIKEILIDDENTFSKARLFMKTVMPRYQRIIKLYKESRPLFAKYDLEKQIRQIYNRDVRLKSGGSIVIESTEAMVTIDVNSGQLTESKDIEETALKTNLEAADEISRQLALRDLGGLIAIDFIDMRNRENIRTVEKAIRDGMKNDRAHVLVGKISKFGILELSRQRLSPPLMEKSHTTCPLCGGTGMILSVETAAFMALRDIRYNINKTKPKSVDVKLPLDVGLYILNRQREYVERMEKEFSASINIGIDNDLKRGDIRIDQNTNHTQ
ncbi:MAG: ribonuclease [Deltaproteobacteria bacterium]|nr:MAG: ribonuclease [Deltaproteobacteria bacterium]